MMKNSPLANIAASANIVDAQTAIIDIPATTGPGIDLDAGVSEPRQATETDSKDTPVTPQTPAVTPLEPNEDALETTEGEDGLVSEPRLTPETELQGNPPAPQAATEAPFVLSEEALKSRASEVWTSMKKNRGLGLLLGKILWMLQERIKSKEALETWADENLGLSVTRAYNLISAAKVSEFIDGAIDIEHFSIEKRKIKSADTALPLAAAFKAGKLEEIRKAVDELCILSAKLAEKPDKRLVDWASGLGLPKEEQGEKKSRKPKHPTLGMLIKDVSKKTGLIIERLKTTKSTSQDENLSELHGELEMFIEELRKFLANMATPSDKDAPSSPVAPAQGTSVPPEEPSPSANKATPTPSTDTNVSQGQEPSTEPNTFMPPLKQPEEEKELTQVSDEKKPAEVDQEKPAQDSMPATAPAAEGDKDAQETQELSQQPNPIILPVKEEDAIAAVDEAFNSIRLEREERARKKCRKGMKLSHAEDKSEGSDAPDGEMKEFTQTEMPI